MAGTTVKLGATALGLTLALGLAACSGKAAPSESSPSAGSEHSPTTPAPTSTVDKVTWALYRDVATLDPIYAFDYPENTAVAAMCETLIRQEPDGTTVPGLASDIDTSDPTNLVFTLRDGVTFWDGNPLTPEDVVYSLERQATTSTGYYGSVYQNVKAIKATGANEVTISLKKPDALLIGELSSTPGFITEKAYT